MREIIQAIDGYKADHRRQYPAKTQFVYSNFTPRGTRIMGQNKVVFIGLQYFCQRYLIEEFAEGFFCRDIDEICEKYERRMNNYLGPNNGIGSDHIRALHELGYLPLEIRALPEGTHVPLRIPMLTIENTHPDFAWVTNYFETLLSNLMWMPCTSATQASRMRNLLDNAAVDTGSPEEFVDFQGHDFSMRGMPGLEAAQISGLGHLLFFAGTDTIPAIELVEDYYPGSPEGYLIGGSVAATEHSVMCAGQQQGEMETFDHLLDLYPEGIVSAVSDTWDLWHVLTEILPTLKGRIMERNGKLVIRPDSGDPTLIICGDPSAPLGSPARKGVVQCLWDVFGGTETATGHRLLDSHVGVIYGDSMTEERVTAILKNLTEAGFASANMVFGIGSFNYQYVTRDTFMFAMKATWVQIDGVGYPIFKAPITDDGMKNSAKGRLAVAVGDDTNELLLINEASPAMEEHSMLAPVWRNGQFVRYESFETIRNRARSV